jgi:inorganic triphosphatase YgiF
MPRSTDETRRRAPREIELKLALPLAIPPKEWPARLASAAPLSGREATRLRVHSVYYDTADQTLR